MIILIPNDNKIILNYQESCCDSSRQICKHCTSTCATPYLIFTTSGLSSWTVSGANLGRAVNAAIRHTGRDESKYLNWIFWTLLWCNRVLSKDLKKTVTSYLQDWKPNSWTESCSSFLNRNMWSPPVSNYLNCGQYLTKYLIRCCFCAHD